MSQEKSKIYGRDDKIISFNVDNGRNFTPSDTVTFSPISSFHSNEDGTVKVEYPNGNVATYYVVAGAVYAYKVVKIFFTGSTVTDVVLHN